MGQLDFNTPNIQDVYSPDPMPEYLQIPFTAELPHQEHQVSEPLQLGPVGTVQRNTGNDDEDRQKPSFKRNIGSAFPIEAFPAPLQNTIRETNKALGFPVDFTGMGILAAASAAIGNTFQLEIKRGWYTTCPLYLVVVGPPGSCKSHPLAFCMTPLRRKDNVSYKAYCQQRDEFDQYMALPKREKSEIQPAPVKPALSKTLISDVTPEALNHTHKNNPRGLCLHSDELAGWFGNFNRYNSGSESKVWLSMWSGQAITVDRVGGEPLMIPKPFVTVIGGIQNEILNDLYKENREKDGFTDRLLYGAPDGLGMQPFSEAELEDKTIREYEGVIERLLTLPLPYDDEGNCTPRTIRFNYAAKQRWIEWFNENTRLTNSQDDSDLKGVYSKLTVQCSRLALIIQLLNYSCNEAKEDAIELKSIEGAIMLTEYFRHMAQKVRQIVNGENAASELTGLKKCLYDELPEAFEKKVAKDLAKKVGVSSATLGRFLKEQQLFENVRHGHYQKIG
ncbi:YfjI family protein [Tellurirhabdus rosea]|uniref:YfjI family protein n=1 Tax=Tellurirhabdus rosea TaxID=2674997 RepID=UPI0022507F06|nr:YfjI family protein [Tellurirhabdus rosea]